MAKTGHDLGHGSESDLDGRHRRQGREDARPEAGGLAAGDRATLGQIARQVDRRPSERKVARPLRWSTALHLQRSAGNAAVAGLLRPRPVPVGPALIQTAAAGMPDRLTDDINRLLDFPPPGVDLGDRVAATIRAAPAGERRNALQDPRIVARLGTGLPRAKGLAALGALGASLSQRLDLALDPSPPGPDGPTVAALIRSASAAQRQEVLRSPAVLTRIRTGLSRADALTALGGLGASLIERLNVALEGAAAVDQPTVEGLIRGSSADQRRAVLADGTLMENLRNRLTRAGRLSALALLGASLLDRLNATVDGAPPVDAAAAVALARGASAGDRAEVLGDRPLIDRLRAAFPPADMLNVLTGLQASLADRFDLALGTPVGTDEAAMAAMITGSREPDRMAVHDDLGLMTRLKDALAVEVYWRLRLLVRFGTQARVDARSPLPQISNGVQYRVDAHIRANEQAEALRVLVQALEARGSLDSAVYEAITFDAGGAGEATTTVVGWDRAPAAAGAAVQPWTPRGRPRIAVHAGAFAAADRLVATVMREFQRARDMSRPSGADPTAPQAVTRREFEALLWQIERRADMGIGRNRALLVDVRDRMTAAFNNLDAVQQRRFRTRYDRAVAAVNRVPAPRAAAAPAESLIALITRELGAAAPNTDAILTALRGANRAALAPVKANRSLVDRMVRALPVGRARETLEILGTTLAQRLHFYIGSAASADDIVALLNAATASQRTTVRANRGLVDRLLAALAPADVRKVMAALGGSLTDEIERALQAPAPRNPLADAVRAAAPAARSEIVRNSTLMERIRTSLGDYEYWKIRLLLQHGTEASFPPVATTMVNTLGPAAPAGAAVRAVMARMTDADWRVLKEVVGIREVLRALIAEPDLTIVLRMLQQGLRAEQTGVTGAIPETLQIPDATGTYQPRAFTATRGFDIAYSRDRLEITVRISVTAAGADANAATWLPNAQRVWENNIEGAWNRKYKVRNAEREIPVIFNANFTGSSPHHTVTAHSGIPVWPGLNQSNWFVPDPSPGATAATIANNTYVSNAAIHEFGHMVGNPDEYNLSAAHFTTVVGTAPRTPATAAEPSGHVIPDVREDTDIAGTPRYTHVRSVMGGHLVGTSVPGPVLARHLNFMITWINTNRPTTAVGAPVEPAFTLVHT